MEANSKNIELIRGDYKKAVKKLSVPTMISLLVASLYNLTDSIWISALSADALAALGFILPFFYIVMGFGSGLAVGVNSAISRQIGANDHKQASNTAIHGILLAIVFSILIGVFSYYTIPIFLDIGLVGVEVGLSESLALEYGQILFAAIIPFILCEVEVAILRSEGDAKRGMYVMLATVILNIILDPIMIFTLNMNIAGAALATVISETIGCLILIYWIHYKKDTYLGIKRENFTFSFYHIKQILSIALPSTFEDLITSILNMAENIILLLSGGYLAVAAYSAVCRLTQLIIIPIKGLGVSMITLAGNMYGEKNYGKLKSTYFYTLKLSIIITTLLIVLSYVFAPQIGVLFASGDIKLSVEVSKALRLMIITILSVCFGVISCNFFQEIGKGTISLIITVIRSSILKVIFTIFLFYFIFNMGVNGVYFGGMMCGIISGTIAFSWALYYLRKLLKHDDDSSISN